MTDDWDRRCIMNILNDFYSPAVLSDEHKFSESGIYHQLPLTSDHEVLKRIVLISSKGLENGENGGGGGALLLSVFLCVSSSCFDFLLLFSHCCSGADSS